ncbi:hypothetical protein ASZ90_006493 [hydrocarbon metagenome]|uniref:Uncharacterized protein n=1 Tax=hydrocarbon metagenome TaxID=938273 RepID=A0A0W8FS36_9ZZZZ
MGGKQPKIRIIFGWTVPRKVEGEYLFNRVVKVKVKLD